MTDKAYDHQIYHITHPLVRKLIMQAIEVRKFRGIYPSLFDELSHVRKDIYKQLIEGLKGPVQQYFEYEDEEQLYDQLDIILIERRLVDQAIGYIQTGEVFLHDEFLVRNILTKQELEAIFHEISCDFWEKLFPIYDPSTLDDSLLVERKKTLNNVIVLNNWYLPNLMPTWTIEELFVDYVPVFLKYDKYKNSATSSTKKHLDSIELKRYPTASEVMECLKDIFLYDQPLLNAKGAFIDFHTTENGERSSNYFGLNVDLDDSSINLPHLLSEFMTAYASRRLDYYRGGQQNAFKEGHEVQQMSLVGNTILSMLDKLTNRMTVLDRADCLISGLLTLLYVDGVFSGLTDDEKSELEYVNLIEMLIYFNFIEESEEEHLFNLKLSQETRQKILVPLKQYKIDNLIQKIMQLFEGNKEVKVMLQKQSGKKPTQIVFSIEHEKLSYELNIKDLKRKIKTMLGHFFLNEEEHILKGKSQNSLGLSPIFTPLFQVVK